MTKKHVYFFRAGRAEGNKDMKNILGGKGANLAEMAGLGLPVPPGFTVSTEVCDLYYKSRKSGFGVILEDLGMLFMGLVLLFSKKGLPPMGTVPPN